MARLIKVLLVLTILYCSAVPIALEAENPSSDEPSARFISKLDQFNEIEPVWEYIEVELPEVSSVSKPTVDEEFELFVMTTRTLETGWDKSPKWKYNYNPGGLRCYGNRNKDSDGYCIYDSEEQGMNALRDTLITYYEKYGTDYKTIREIYCACGPEDYPKFMNIYNQLGGH